MEFNNEWNEVLKDDFKGAWAKSLKEFLIEESKCHKIFPPANLIFNALNLTPYSSVKVVILGQDPYHNDGQAHGLCFSVLNHEPPPSLQNIYKEIESDIGKIKSKDGNLSDWARQGVLLLNTCLTVRAHEPNSHQGKGWGNFTSAVLKHLNKCDKPIVFLLWGRNAKEYSQFLTNKNHLILYAPHPSPLSAYTGFFGCKHFSKTNTFLKENGLSEIEW